MLISLPARQPQTFPQTYPARRSGHLLLGIPVRNVGPARAVPTPAAIPSYGSARLHGMDDLFHPGTAHADRLTFSGPTKRRCRLLRAATGSFPCAPRIFRERKLEASAEHSLPPFSHSWCIDCILSHVRLTGSSPLAERSSRCAEAGQTSGRGFTVCQAKGTV